MKTHTFILAAIAAATAVAASPYPTVPISDTTWTVGKSVTATWIDKGSPALSALGPMKLDLMSGADTNQILVVNLANGVKPTAGKANFTLPKFSGPPGPNYFIRFTTSNKVYFTTRFTILGVSGNLPAPPPPAPTSNQATTDSSAASPSSGPLAAGFAFVTSLTVALAWIC